MTSDYIFTIPASISLLLYNPLQLELINFDTVKMVSFWGKKTDDTPRAEESSHTLDHDEHEPATYQEPTERTRLLPRDQNQGYLSPDDPAVNKH